MNTPNVLLVGPSGIGKTSYVRRVTTGQFQTTHTPTGKIRNYTFDTNIPVRLEAIDLAISNCNIWDTPGDRTMFGQQIDHLFLLDPSLQFDVVYIFYDRATQEELPSWIQTVYDHIPLSVPLFIIRAKVDDKHNLARVSFTKQIMKSYNISDRLDLSSHSNYNLYKPIKIVNGLKFQPQTYVR